MKRTVVSKTLLVSRSVPPAIAGSSSIVVGLARQFSADELTLVGEYVPGPNDSVWVNDESQPRLIHIHHQWKWRFKRTVRLFLSPVIFARLLSVYRKEKCDQIVAVYPDEFYLCLAWMVARITGCRFFSYFHNTYLDNRSGFRRLFASWLQPRVFKDSELVFVMSDGMKEIWTELYPNQRFCTLVHSSSDKAVASHSERTISQSFSIAFMGNLNESNHDAMSRLGGVLRRYPKCRLTTFSGASPAIFADLGLVGERITNTRVGHDKVVQALSKFDVLFLPHGFIGGLNRIEYQTIFPTRTIPYLLSGVPIVAHTPPDAFLTKWLRDHDCALIVDEPSEESICRAIDTLRENPGRCNELVSNALQAAKQFDASSVAERLKRGISPVCGQSLMGEDVASE